jgi:hypothetical protein
MTGVGCCWQTAGNFRRSYRLDGMSAMAIAAQRNRESSVYDTQDFSNVHDIVIIYNERTVLWSTRYHLFCVLECSIVHLYFHKCETYRSNFGFVGFETDYTVPFYRLGLYTADVSCFCIFPRSIGNTLATKTISSFVYYFILLTRANYFCTFWNDIDVCIDHV